MKVVFIIRGIEVGKIIPFDVYMIQFPVLESYLYVLIKNEKHFIKEVIWSETWKWEK